MKNAILLVLGFVLMSCQHHHKNEEMAGMGMDEILASSHRPSKNTARDTYRNPKETLQFFEVEPHMKVLEISPGGGWYTEILGPYLKQGELRLAVFSDQSEKKYRQRLNKKLREKINAHKNLYGKISYSIMDLPKILGPLAEPNSMDRVLTFRNVHGWMDGKGMAKKVFKEFFNALKPGGMLGVVEHRASSRVKQDPKAENGYVRQDYVIALAESAGFQLVASSEINANSKDTANHPKGVWTLPPSLALKDKNKAKYSGIGESDRMTLKFIKPKKI